MFRYPKRKNQSRDGLPPWNDGRMDKILGGQTNEWMDMQCMCIDMQKSIISNRFCNFYNGIYNFVADYNSTWRVSSVCVSQCVCVSVCVSRGKLCSWITFERFELEG